ncbi:MAG TPA: TolC family protein [Polyangia bacterium]|nr:TolC family protein [Polyangia bacterium]
MHNGIRICAALAALVATTGLAHAASRTLTIDEAVALALRSNPRLAAARARAESGEVLATSTGRRMLPSIHVSDEAQYWNAPFAVAFGPMAFTVREQKTNTFVAAGAQPLVGLLRANDEQTAQAEQSAAQRAQVAAAEADLRATVETQFLRVFEAQALEQIAAASIRELGDQVTVAKARLASGVITNADLLRIEVAVANAQQQALEARSQAQTARAQLFAAIGLAPADAADFTLVEPTERLNAARSPKAAGTLGSLLPLAAQRRPELAQYAHLVSAAERQRRASGFALLPDIDFEAAYVRTDGQQFAPKNSAYVGLKANWAIWEWGATALQRKSAIIQAEAAQRDREMLERQIESELTASLAQGDAARGAVGSADKAVASAEEAYRVTDAAVKAGSQTTTDLLQAQSELTQARLNLIRAQYELVLSDVALARATGR